MAQTAAALIASMLLVAGCSGLPSAPGSGDGGFNAASEKVTIGAEPAAVGQSAPAAARTARSTASAAVIATATSVSASVPVSAGRSPAPRASPSGAAGTSRAAPLAPPKLPSVPGYTFATAPAAIVTAFKPLAATGPGVFSAPTVRSVERGGVTVCSMAAMRINPGVIANRAAAPKLVSGLVEGMAGKGYAVRNRTVAGQPVLVAFGTPSTVVAWSRGGTVVLLVSIQPSEDVLAFAAAYIKRS